MKLAASSRRTPYPARGLRRFRIDPSSPILPLLILVASAAVGYVLLFRFGLKMSMVALGGLVVSGLLIHISMRDLSYATIGWFLSMGTFRGVGLVSMPGLPDFSFDRLMLVWIVLVLVFRQMLERERTDRIRFVDAIVVIQVAYIFVQMQAFGNLRHFHEWVLSSLSPLFGFIYGKYVVRDEKFIRNMMYFFFALTVYFYVTSIAEHFHMNFLVWPKAILDPHVGFWAKGRSRGPLLHPPLFGQVLGILCLVHFYFIARTRKLGIMVLLYLSLALAFLGNFFAYTRGPWLATGVAVMLLGLLRPNYRRVLMVFGVVATIGIVLGLTQLANNAFLQERLGAQNTVENRLGFLANAYRMLKDHPFFGIGYFKYMDNVGLYNQTSYIPFYGMVKRSLSAAVPIHDIYLGRAAEEGLIGLAMVLTFYALTARSWLALWRRNLDGEWLNRDLLALFAAMMVCYLVGGMIIDYRYFDFVNVLFYFLAGIICGFDGRTGSLHGQQVARRYQAAGSGGLVGRNL